MKLFVKNLSLDVTADQLLEAFEEHGWVDSVDIINNGITGESLGFGFVVMSTSADGHKAVIGLNGKELFGSIIEVTEDRRDRSERREFEERRGPEPRRKLSDRRSEHNDRRDEENRRHDL
ncbi:RNA-binding protein [Candidatus Marinimicrobia bacterium MT.SAG.3]|nr:RNA-binding protein [Candidatus Marinimicrobia bacterium MT.SAG.3]